MEQFAVNVVLLVSIMAYGLVMNAGNVVGIVLHGVCIVALVLLKLFLFDQVISNPVIQNLWCPR